jgi:hypothetical protein
MNYVKNFNFYGKDAKEIPCITGIGTPTEITVGEVGLLYMDTDSGSIYKCIEATNNNYIWKILDNSFEFVKSDEFTDKVGSIELTLPNKYKELYIRFKIPASDEELIPLSNLVIVIRLETLQFTKASFCFAKSS